MAVHKNSSIDNEYAYMLDSSVFDLNRIHKIIEKYYIKSTIKNEKYIDWVILNVIYWLCI